MSVAEKLIAKGRVEGRAKGRAEGLWIGKIQTLEEFLGLRASSCESLAALSLDDLKATHQRLHEQYETRFKR